MAQEIELKFIVNHSAVEALRDHLNTLGGEHHDPVQLLNIYYETPDNWLRGHDMGLRIRGENGRYEMTMKVAGRVTGGLHQRPEYNVALSETDARPGAVTDGSLAERRIARRSRLPRAAAVQHRFLSRKMAGGGRW
ncbi:putative adenylate cyclase [Escherichia coli]|nr:putative adenylate cyclase [Escherichia coli]